MSWKKIRFSQFHNPSFPLAAVDSLNHRQRTPTRIPPAMAIMIFVIIDILCFFFPILHLRSRQSGRDSAPYCLFGSKSHAVKWFSINKSAEYSFLCKAESIRHPVVHLSPDNLCLRNPVNGQKQSFQTLYDLPAMPLLPPA